MTRGVTGAVTDLTGAVMDVTGAAPEHAPMGRVGSLPAAGRPERPRRRPVDKAFDKEREVDNEAAFDKFRDCAVEVLQVPAEKVTMEARFAEDLDADSLDLVELVMALEEAFGVTVDESELEDIETAGQAFELISSKL